MEPAEKTASPHQWTRTTTSGPEEDHSRSRRSNGWAECREKNIGIEPMENTFLLTFLLIGHCCMDEFPIDEVFAHHRGKLPRLSSWSNCVFSVIVPARNPLPS